MAHCASRPLRGLTTASTNQQYFALVPPHAYATGTEARKTAGPTTASSA